MRTSLARSLRVAAVVGGSLLLAVGASASSTGWTAKSIGGPGFTPMDINSAGTVVGYGGSSSQEAVVVRNDVVTVLPTSSNVIGAVADAINNAGTIVGTALLDDYSREAVMWDSKGHMALLGFLPGGSFSQASDINDRGQIVGTANGPGWQYQAVVWDKGPGSASALPPLAGIEESPYPTSFGEAINNSGQIVGNFSAWYVPQQAVLWRNENSAPTALTPLVAGTFAYAGDINNAGEIVGNSKSASPGFQLHAVVWKSGTPTDLGQMGTWAVANAINDRGQIVGYWQDSGNATHAFVSEKSVITPLDPLAGDAASFANGINNAGKAIGTSGTWPTTRGAIWAR